MNILAEVYIPRVLQTLNTAQTGLPRGVELQAMDAEKTGERLDHLSMIPDCDQQGLFSLKNLILGYFSRGKEGRNMRCILVGSAAITEINGEGEWNDLDILVVGLSQNDLISEGFIRVLVDSGYEIRVGQATNPIYKAMHVRGNGLSCKVDIFSTRLEQAVCKPIPLVESMLCLVNVWAGLEICDGYFQVTEPFSNALEAERSGKKLNLQARSVHDPADALRLVGAASTEQTISPRELNEIRKIWIGFRGDNCPRDESNVVRISETAREYIASGFEQARRYSLEERYFGLLWHTGAFHALFPLAMACSGHRLTCDYGEEGRNLFQILRKNGFSLSSLNDAIAKCFIEKARDHIALVVDECSMVLPENWYTSYKWNLIILLKLLERKLPTKDPHSSLVGLGRRRNKRFENIWNIVGPYFESLVLFEVLRFDWLMSAAYRLGEVEPYVSIWGRYGIVIERLNTEILRYVAMGEIDNECSEAVGLFREYEDMITRREQEVRDLYRIRDIVLLRKIAVMSVFFDHWRVKFTRKSIMEDLLAVDMEVSRQIKEEFDRLMVSYEFAYLT